MTPVAHLAQACVQRPVATILLAVALVLAGLLVAGYGVYGLARLLII